MSTVMQAVFRFDRLDVKRIIDHNEGVRSDDVLERHYTLDDRLDLKQPVMARWLPWTEEQAAIAAAALPPVAELRAELARRRRERELAGKGKRTVAAAAVEDEDKALELTA
jgi:hypothetical protein